MGIFSTTMNKQGAIAGMVAGLTFTFLYIVYFRFLAPAQDTAEHWWLGISPEGIGAVGAALNFATAAVVARVTPAVPPQVKELVERIRVPREARPPVVP
jgi:cation/acetate symporter